MADFAQISSNESNYPLEPKPQDSSAEFVTPYKLQTGVMRGTQTIANTDGTKIYIGQIPKTNTFGIAFADATGKIVSQITGSTYSFFNSDGALVSKIEGPTQYVYDITTGKNIIQIGKLPDGTYGMAVAKAGYNVSDGIS